MVFVTSELLGVVIMALASIYVGIVLDDLNKDVHKLQDELAEQLGRERPGELIPTARSTDLTTWLGLAISAVGVLAALIKLILT